MSDNEKDKVYEGEVVDKDTTEQKEEKKENAFSKFWKKTKQAVNDSVLENKIESAFDKRNDDFSVYSKNELLSKRVTGFLTNNVLTIYGEEEFNPYSVVISEKTDKAYYVLSTEKTEVVVELEGENYKRPATAITLDENVEEVNVIKAGKRYFIYKGTEK